MKKARKLTIFMIAVLCICIISIGVSADEEENVRSAITINRLYSTYSQTSTAGQKLRYAMNCYGYALQIYALGANSGNTYKQQPGEFVIDQESYDGLSARILNILNTNNANDALDGIEDLIESDFAELYSSSSPNNEWVIEPSSASASVPSGYRKIALAIGLHKGYHFYLRHSDGKWSHKQGNGNPSNKVIGSNVIITDSNISSAVLAGDYSDGARFYLIKKSAIADYPHVMSIQNNTHSYYSTPMFKDRAGDTISKARIISSSTINARFDHSEDIDYFAYTPGSPGSYTFTTNLTGSAYNVQMTIYDYEGNVLATDAASGNPSITLNLTAGKRIFIRVYDENDNVVSYNLIRN